MSTERRLPECIWDEKNTLTRLFLVNPVIVLCATKRGREKEQAVIYDLSKRCAKMKAKVKLMP